MNATVEKDGMDSDEKVKVKRTRDAWVTPGGGNNARAQSGTQSASVVKCASVGEGKAAHCSGPSQTNPVSRSHFLSHRSLL